MKSSDSTPIPAATFAIPGAARYAVERMAPEELTFLNDVLAAWRRQDLAFQRGSRRAAGGTVGFGVDVTLLTETVLAALSGASAEVLGAVVTDAWQRRRWWRRGDKVGQAALRAAQQLTLTDDQVDRLRGACRRHGLALGLTEQQADLLADAVNGAMQAPDHR